MLHSMTIRFIHMCISLRPSTYGMGSNVNLGSTRVIGFKRSFSLKMLLLVNVHNMNERLIHVDQLDHLSKSYHFKNLSGVIWGHRGQKVIFTKMF